MRRAVFIAGIVLTLIAVILLLWGMSVANSSVSQNVPAGSALSLDPTSLTSVTVKVHWTGATGTSRAYLVTGTGACPPAKKTIVANVSGASGTFSRPLTPGTHYSLYDCTGTKFQSATFSYTTSGAVTTLEVVSGFLIFVGIIVLLLGLRRPLAEIEAEERARLSKPIVGQRPIWMTTQKSPRRPLRPAPVPSGSASASSPARPRPPTSSASTASVSSIPSAEELRPTTDGRTMRGCLHCGRISAIGDSGVCPYCGTPYGATRR